MSEPTTAAGRSIGEALLVLTTVDWSKHITAIEAEAATAERAAIRAEIVAILAAADKSREVASLFVIFPILDAREPAP